MAFVVHDLKNPVSTMDLHAHVLLREPEMSENAHESAAHIRTAARQLTRMILNLLDVSKADEGRLSPKRSEIDLRALVIDILAELEVNVQARNVALESTLESPSASARRSAKKREAMFVRERTEPRIRVLPRPAEPHTSVGRFFGRPPPVTRSSPEIPEGVFSRDFARAERVGRGRFRTAAFAGRELTRSHG